MLSKRVTLSQMENLIVKKDVYVYTIKNDPNYGEVMVGLCEGVRYFVPIDDPNPSKLLKEEKKK